MAKTGPKRKGTLYWTKTGWRARLTVDVDGVAIKKSFDLETTNKAVARVKLKRLADKQAPTAADAARSETFREAAERIVRASDIRSKQRRLERLDMYAYPQIGAIPVTELKAADVKDVLNEVAAKGLSRQLCVHVKNDIGAVLGELWRDEVLPENVVARVRVPKGAAVDTRERAVLTDEELITYLAWSHPDERLQASVRERQTMACVSRCFGGLRLGDIRAIRWEAFEVDEGRFPSGWAPRKKSARPQRLEVPAVLRPMLRDWWERAGRPTEGPVFPVRRGERAGEERKHSSPAKALRRDLRRAFGIDAWREVTIVRSNGRPMTRMDWAPARDLSHRERELLEETEVTRPVDFHSFRRAFKQALAEAGVELTQAMALSGASDVKAHQRYLANTAKMRSLPDAALPAIASKRDMSHVSLALKAGNESGETDSFLADCGSSSVGRARASQARGRGFEPRLPLRKDKRSGDARPQFYCACRSSCCGGRSRPARDGLPHSRARRTMNEGPVPIDTGVTVVEKSTRGARSADGGAADIQSPSHSVRGLG